MIDWCNETASRPGIRHARAAFLLGLFSTSLSKLRESRQLEFVSAGYHELENEDMSIQTDEPQNVCSTPLVPRV